MTSARKALHAAYAKAEKAKAAGDYKGYMAAMAKADKLAPVVMAEEGY